MLATNRCGCGCEYGWCMLHISVDVGVDVGVAWCLYHIGVDVDVNVDVVHACSI